MDLAGEDACDKAKKNGMALTIQTFNNCSISFKKKGLLPIKKLDTNYLTKS